VNWKPIINDLQNRLVFMKSPRVWLIAILFSNPRDTIDMHIACLLRVVASANENNITDQESNKPQNLGCGSFVIFSRIRFLNRLLKLALLNKSRIHASERPANRDHILSKEVLPVRLARRAFGSLQRPITSFVLGLCPRILGDIKTISTDSRFLRANRNFALAKEVFNTRQDMVLISPRIARAETKNETRYWALKTTEGATGQFALAGLPLLRM